MKKIRLLVVIITFLSLTFSTYAFELNYEGVENYTSTYQNSNFTDVGNHWAKKSIYKMGILGVVKGTSKFYPNGKISREEALMWMVRLMGGEEEAQTLAQSNIKEIDTGKYKFNTKNDTYMDAYIQVAQNLGILTGDEVKKIEKLSDSQKEKIDLAIEKKRETYEQDENLKSQQLRNIEKILKNQMKRAYTWKVLLNKEQASIWVAKMVGLNPIYDNQQKIYTMRDFKNIQTENAPMIEAALQAGIISGDKGRLNPKNSITRGQLAAILDAASETILEVKGYTTEHGEIQKIQNYVSSEQNPRFLNLIGVENAIITILNDDGIYGDILIQGSTTSTFHKGFPVYKNGKVNPPSVIGIGDMIKIYKNPEGKIFYGEIE
ncbi:S-layer homology domain-containing protein [Inediibacterium massiliense]|uniref:S-layer homology domain-containing protein n=1 Tax=Inediibacterium massiliense TaxID=1658111 RepID=UPI0006B4E0F6|nr:S-layer homology domain-containing protein [Inediibacterium massiliense]